MVAKTTQGVKVSVETFYQSGYSNPANSEYFFAYKITIENFSEHRIRLLKRHWQIFDSNGMWREVEGEGVVGNQPVLESGKSYQYVSGCNLKSEIGKMSGTYLMENTMDGKTFLVNIPEFRMFAPHKLN